jgi:CRP-like cAMP-binding protein
MGADAMADSSGFHRVTFEQNSLLFDEAQTGDAAYLITKGEVEIRTGVRGESPRVLARQGTGDIVGEMALFDNRSRMAAAIAMTPVEAIRISRDEFRHRLNDMDPVMRSILLVLVKRLRQMNDELAEYKRTDWRPAG